MMREKWVHSLAGVALSLGAAPACASGKAPVIEPGRALTFGAIVAGDEAGQVTVSPDGAIRCLGVRCLAGARAGDFFVSGAPDYAVAISVSATTVRSAGGETMRVELAPSTNTLILSGRNGRGTFAVGGTLSLRASQPEGDYRGDYLVTADYL